jgi:hypothetical protein
MIQQALFSCTLHKFHDIETEFRHCAATLIMAFVHSSEIIWDRYSVYFTPHTTGKIVHLMLLNRK